MLSQKFDKISFWSLFSVIVFLPLFFLPGTGIALDVSKGLLLVLGTAISVIAWSAARFSDGKIILPKSYIWFSVFFVLFSIFLSSLLSSTKSVSFFGSMLDVGTFWFMFVAFFFMLFVSLVINDAKKVKTVLWGSIFAFSVVLVFQILRIILFRGENPIDLSFGSLPFLRISNLVGSWVNFGIVSSLFAFISLYLIEFFKPKESWKNIFLIIFSFLSLFMVILVNVPFVWLVFCLFSVLIFSYKVAISGKKEEGKRYFPVFSFIFVLVSILFLTSSNFIGNFLPSKLNLVNVEFGPSVESTLKITKESLRVDPVFGVGPNRFMESWALYKPVDINMSDFWDTPFSFAFGLVPTFMSTTGILGILAWLTFVFSVLFFGFRFLIKNMFKEENKEAIMVFFIALYLLIISLLYVSNLVVFFLTLAFLGIFIALKGVSKEKGNFHFNFLDDPRKSLFSILFLFFLMILSAGLTFKYVEKFASTFSFAYIANAQDIDKAILKIERAIQLNPNDLYFRVASQIYLSKMNIILNKEAEPTEEETQILQAGFQAAVLNSEKAVEYNQYNYLNHLSLAGVYSFAGSLGVEGSFEKAIDSYKQASSLNPNNPGIKKEIAQIYFMMNDLVEAEKYAKEALSLKPNLITTIILLSRIEREKGNNSLAIEYAEQAKNISSLPEITEYINFLKGEPTLNPTIQDDILSQINKTDLDTDTEQP